MEREPTVSKEQNRTDPNPSLVETLRESEKTFRALAESSPNMIFINHAGRIVYANKRCIEVMEYSQEEFYDPKFVFMMLIAPEYQEPIKAMFRSHAAGTEVSSMEYALITKGGKRVEAIYSSRLITFQGKPAVLGVVTDITERKLKEAALRESEARLKDAQELGRMGSWEFDIETQKITWSDQTYRLYDRDPALKPPTPEEEAIYYPEVQAQKLRENAKQAISEGRTLKCDLEAKLPSGRTPFFSVVMQPMKDAHGRVVKLIGTVQDITERKNAEKTLQQATDALKTSEDHYRNFVKRLPGVVYEGRVDFTPNFFHGQVFELTGYTEAEFLAGTPRWDQIVYPKDWAQIKDEATKIGTIPNYHVRRDYRIIRKDGSIRWISEDIQSVPSDDGRVDHVQGLLYDITDRKRAEIALKESEENFRVLFEDSPNSLWVENCSEVKKYLDRLQTHGITDYNAYFEEHPQEIRKCVQMVKILDVNQASLQMYEASTKTEFFQGLQVIFTEASFAQFKEAIVALAQGHTIHEMEAITCTLKSKKKQILIRTSIPPECRESWGMVLVSIVDITPRKQVEEALRASEETYRLLFEKASDIIIVMDVTGRITSISPSVADIAGYEPKEIEGRCFWELPMLSIYNEKIKEIFTKLLMGGSNLSSTFEFRSKTGHALFLEVLSKILFKEGKPAVVINFGRDVTARKIEEEKLRQIEQERQTLLERTLQISDLKSNLITQAAHELKTPLTVILGWGDLLYAAKKQGKSLDTTFDIEDLETIVRNAERLNDIINDLLDVGRINRGKFEINKEDIDFREIIENATRAT